MNPTITIWKFVHVVTGAKYAGPAGTKGGIKLGMQIDTSDPNMVTITYMGNADDQEFLDFAAAACPEEISAWTERLWHPLLEMGALNATQRCVIAAAKWRQGGWTGQPLNRPLPKKED